VPSVTTQQAEPPPSEVLVGAPSGESRVQPQDLLSPADRFYRRLSSAAGISTMVLMGLIGAFLWKQSRPAFKAEGILKFLTTFQWTPDAGKFGIGAVLWWTIVIAVIAMSLAVPVAIMTALFINEYAPRRMRALLTGLVDLLAAVPSLIYGLWGFTFLLPRISSFANWISDHFGFIPVFSSTLDSFVSSPFLAGLVVSLMVLPICTAVMREVFSLSPPGEKEGALALGATQWGMIRTVVLPFGAGGIVGGSMLGLGRALGETIAVAIIISPSFTITPRILERGGNSIASLIALRWSEASPNIGLPALIAAGLALFLITLAVNTGATIVISKARSGAGVDI
jgi:phosphate transport system permease protein